MRLHLQSEILAGSIRNTNLDDVFVAKFAASITEQAARTAAIANTSPGRGGRAKLASPTVQTGHKCRSRVTEPLQKGIRGKEIAKRFSSATPAKKNKQQQQNCKKSTWKSTAHNGAASQ